MRRRRELALWTLVAAAGIALIALAGPRVFPLLPRGLEVSRADARAVALEALRELAPIPGDADVVVHLRTDGQLERRLQLLAAQVPPEALRETPLARAQVVWDVLVYPIDARPGEWSARAFVALDGRVVMARVLASPESQGEILAEDEAVRRAAAHLASLGIDVSRFESGAEVDEQGNGRGRRQVVQFREDTSLLGTDYPFGLEVHLVDGESRGHGLWYRDPHRAELQETFRQSQLVNFAQGALLYVLLPLVAVPFFREYHAGRLGVRRGVHVFLLAVGAGLVYVVLAGESIAEGTNFGLLTRSQMTWMVGGTILVFQALGLGVLGLMAWSTGEAYCRRYWPQKLAALDAIFRGKWANSTVALSAYRGLAGGLLMTGVTYALAVAARPASGWMASGFVYTSRIDGPLPALAFLATVLCFLLPLYLFVYLFVPCWAAHRWGPTAALVVAIPAAILLVPNLFVLPLQIGWAIWAAVAAVPVVLFRWGDLLSALLAATTMIFLVTCAPLLHAGDPWTQGQGLFVALVLAGPWIASLRDLGGDREFTYAWDDVPPHVRRIAERERQQVEIETARSIQESILPELPDSVAGLELATLYRPASEVGGDFYDLIDLGGGRVAVAIGDVAGHGVASGLVMAMVKAALEVRVGDDPAPSRVFETLNALVHRSARRRLLATLCYAVVDTTSRQIRWGSAGHVFPYRISPAGDVEPLEAGGYPLGVRRELPVGIHEAPLGPGDVLFFCSDGLIEACPEGRPEPFGFDRLESSLRRLAGSPPEVVRDGVLADVEAWAGRGCSEDDLTLVVLQLPF